MEDQEIPMHDIVIIGAGLCGLGLAARLREPTPSALFTDSVPSSRGLLDGKTLLLIVYFPVPLYQLEMMSWILQFWMKRENG